MYVPYTMLYSFHTRVVYFLDSFHRVSYTLLYSFHTRVLYFLDSFHTRVLHFNGRQAVSPLPPLAVHGVHGGHIITWDSL